MKQCPFCNRESAWGPLGEYSSNYFFDCPSCGPFGISDVLWHSLSPEKNEEILKISHLLAENKLYKSVKYLLTLNKLFLADNWEVITCSEFLKKYPKDPIEILDRTLLNLSRKTNHPSDWIIVDETLKELFFSKNEDGIRYIMRQFFNMKLTTELNSILPSSIYIETEGWLKITELKMKPAGLQDQAFVAMWFDDSTNNFFPIIENSLRDAIGYKAMRIDSKQHNNKICDEIIAEIKKSKFLIADFTGNRGGVYFEAGYAMGMGIPVIWIVHKNHIKDLHFDTRQYNHIVYNDSNDLYHQLRDRIEATIK